MEQLDPNATGRFNVAKTIITTGWIILVLICAAMMGSALYTVITTGGVPEVLGGWVNTAMGFMFGVFVTMVREFIDRPSAQS